MSGSMKRGEVFLVGLLCAVLSESARAEPSTARYAIIIGHNESLDENRPTLRFADDDAARFYELLAPLAKEVHLLTVFDEKSQAIFSPLVDRAKAPTRAEFFAAMKQIRRAIHQDVESGKRAELYFFFAGHGDVELGEGFFTLADGKVRRSEFERAVLDGTRAHTTHVLIDACKSFFLVAGRGPGGKREKYLTPFALPNTRPGVGYVLSTSNDADSHEWAAVSGGIFSHEVRSALIGGADADDDGAIDYEELAAFIAVANEGIPYPQFRPSVFIQPPKTDVTANLYEYGELSRSTTLTLSGADDGRVSITDQRGLRYADLNKAPGASLRLALLQPLRYEVQWRNNSFTVSSTVSAVSLASLPKEPILLAARGEIHRAFEHLFDTPYGPEVVRGFRLGRVTSKAEQLVWQPPDDDTPWIVSLLTGGAIVVGSGLVLGALASDEYGDAAIASQVDRAEMLDRADALRVGSSAAYAVGAVALTSGIVWLILDLTE